MPGYKFEVKGEAGSGQRWSIGGTVGGGNYLAAHDQVMRETYARLTAGQVNLDSPGKWRCHGPYRIMMVVIEELMQ